MVRLVLVAALGAAVALGTPGAPRGQTAIVELRLEADRTRVRIGDTVTFALAIRNAGSTRIDQLHVSLVPPEESFPYAVSSVGMRDGTCVLGGGEDGRVVSCSLRDLEPGEQRPASLSVMFLSPGPQYARAASLAGGSNPANASAEAVVSVEGCTIVGTREDDSLTGTPGADVICGLDGNDAIRGLDGRDVVWGGPGDDVVDSGRGGDRVFGGPGRDDLDGNSGHDVVWGGVGEDVLSGDDGDDALHGGDRFFPYSGGGGFTIDVVYGGPGADVLTGSTGIDNFFAGAGSDVVVAWGDVGDFVGCGTGRDRARVDDNDDARNCERVTVRHRS